MTHSWRQRDSCDCRHYALICLCLFPRLFLLSHTLVFSWAASHPPPSSLPSGSRLRGAEAAKTHFLELVLASFSFCWTSCAASVIKPARVDSLGETSWCMDSWGDNSLISAFVRIFFFCLIFCVSRGLPSTSVLFLLFLGRAESLFWHDAKQIWFPSETHLYFLSSRSYKRQNVLFYWDYIWHTNAKWCIFVILGKKQPECCLNQPKNIKVGHVFVLNKILKSWRTKHTFSAQVWFIHQDLQVSVPILSFWQS